MPRVAVGLLRIPGLVSVAEGTYRGKNGLSPPGFIMPTITARKQANGSTRYPAVVRLRRGRVHRGSGAPHNEQTLTASAVPRLVWISRRCSASGGSSTVIRCAHTLPQTALLERP
jgi:hypothetical protein